MASGAAAAPRSNVTASGRRGGWQQDWLPYGVLATKGRVTRAGGGADVLRNGPAALEGWVTAAEWGAWVVAGETDAVG